MPLPSGDQPWPPPEVRSAYEKFTEWDAWYSGDPARLKAVYQAPQSDIRQPNPWPWSRFWTRLSRTSVTGQQAAPFHVPLASDISNYAASLLFAESPQIRIAEAHEAADAGPDQADDTQASSGKPPAASSPAQKCEDRLHEINEEGGLLNRLIEAAETASAFGGAYLYPAWDSKLAPWPFLAIAQADNAIPHFRWGRLIDVTFHRIVATDEKTVWRHLELHTPGKIEHALYEGSLTRLGNKRALTQRPETTGLVDVDLPFDEIDVQYVPNSRPNRLDRNSDLGNSDYQGSESLLDALDETYASWMRDIRLAKARIVVPRDFLGNDGKFNVDDEVYTPVDMDPGSAQKNGMLAHQFAIRFAEHQATIDGLILRFVSNAGYSPQTFGLKLSDGGAAESGKALKLREGRTQLTLKRRGAWWAPAIAQVQKHMLLIDKAVFGTLIDVFRPTVTMADSILVDLAELAGTAQAIRSAEAGSTETLIRLLHPDWSDDEVMVEVTKVTDERGTGPNPLDLNGPPEAAPTEADAGTMPDTGTTPNVPPPVPGPVPPTV